MLCSVPLSALPKPFPKRLARQAGAAGLWGRGGGRGRGGEERGGGRSAAAQPRDEWSLCAAAAAPLPRQPSAEEGTGPTPLPLPHPPHPGPSVRCLLSGTPARNSANSSRPGAARSPGGGYGVVVVVPGGSGAGNCPSGVFLGEVRHRTSRASNWFWASKRIKISSPSVLRSEVKPLSEILGKEELPKLPP